MRLFLIGSEYSGKTTLAEGLSRWMIAAMDLPFVRWHNHFVAPQLDRHLVVWADEEKTGARPGKQVDEEFGAEELEQFQRHMFRDDADALFIQGHYATRSTRLSTMGTASGADASGHGSWTESC